MNEESIIEKTVKECLLLRNYNLEVFVVLDSKTTDNTKSVAKKAGASIIDTGEWRGKGAALRKANKYARGDYIVQLDADYQFLPRDIPKLVEPLRNGYDVTLGTRYRAGSKVHKGSVTNFRRFGIFSLSLAASAFSGQRITDVLAGFKAFRKSVLYDIDMREDHYGYEAEVVIKAAQKKYKILEIPIEYRKREKGSSNLNPLKHGFLFLGTILRVGLKLS